MSNLIPIKMNKAELLAVLDDIYQGFLEDDTLEGNIEFLIDGVDSWEVRGTYRVGNQGGQGSLRMIGEIPSGS